MRTFGIRSVARGGTIALLALAVLSGMLVRLDLDDDGRILGEERLLEGEYGRIRDVRAFGDGALWMLTDEANGKVLRVTPAIE